MPITISHQPRASIIGKVANRGGLGRYRLEQQQLGLQQQQIDSANARFVMGQQADRLAREQAMQAAAMENAAQRNQQLGLYQLGMQKDAMEQQRALQARALLGNEELKQKMQFEEFQAQVKAAEEQNQWDIGQKREREKIARARQMIQADDSWTPEQKEIGLRQLAEKEMAIGLPGIRIPTSQDEFDKSVTRYDWGNGNETIFVPDGKGGLRPVEKPKDDAAAQKSKNDMDWQNHEQEFEMNRSKQLLELEGQRIKLINDQMKALEKAHNAKDPLGEGPVFDYERHLATVEQSVDQRIQATINRIKGMQLPPRPADPAQAEMPIVPATPPPGFVPPDIELDQPPVQQQPTGNELVVPDPKTGGTKVYTEADILETAQRYGMTPDQVRETIMAKSLAGMGQ